MYICNKFKFILKQNSNDNDVLAFITYLYIISFNYHKFCVKNYYKFWCDNSIILYLSIIEFSSVNRRFVFTIVVHEKNNSLEK